MNSSHLQPLRRLDGRRPLWSQSQVGLRAFALSADEDEFATLEFDALSFSRAHGLTAEGTWTFKRSGFIHPKVTVRVSGEKSDVAVLSIGWGGQGDLALLDGRAFRWVRAGHWQSEWAFVDTGNEPVIVFRPRFALMRSEAEVDIEDRALHLPELSLLSVLGWYLMVLVHHEQ